MLQDIALSRLRGISSPQFDVLIDASIILPSNIRSFILILAFPALFAMFSHASIDQFSLSPPILALLADFQQDLANCR